MKIVVKLFASLGEYLPPGAERNQTEMDLPDGITPSQLIEQLRVPAHMSHLVMVNGVFVPPSERATQALVEGQEIAMFPPVAGG